MMNQVYFKVNVYIFDGKHTAIDPRGCYYEYEVAKSVYDYVKGIYQDESKEAYKIILSKHNGEIDEIIDEYVSVEGWD